MGKKIQKQLQQRVVLVGCQICGETDLPLKIYNAGRLCPRCAKRVSNSGTEGRKENDSDRQRVCQRGRY